ncbi:MarR family transcriptional regulator [Paenibacillus sp. M1]|uniref:MarR family transcriptional regulator n=1 Tax=Paenibacillus haidiansis TaxID=1574488 RepID=A0ABU7VW07_9BACL
MIFLEVGWFVDHNLDGYIERLLSNWSKTSRKMQSQIMHHRELGLTGPQFHMLTIIAKKKCCNVRYLSERLEVKPSAITVMTDRLVQSGYVERRHDEQDRRSVLLSVTELGAEVLRKAEKRSRKVLESYLADLTPHEQEVLLNIIEKFAHRDTDISQSQGDSDCRRES